MDRGPLWRLLGGLAWAAGLALLIGLIVYQGVGEVLGTVAAVGWGLAAILAFHCVNLAIDAAGWHYLIDRPERPPMATTTRIRWISQAVNFLLPVAQVGGEFVRVRLAMLAGVSGAAAGASVTADVTVGVVTQILFTVAGLFALMQTGVLQDTTLAAYLAVAVAVFTLLVALFLAAQTFGLYGKMTHGIGRLVRSAKWSKVVGGAEAVDAEVRATYRRHGDLLTATLLRLLGWGLGAIEIWMGLYFLGYPVSWVEAFMIESMIQAIRMPAFMVPGALGVQEGGLMILAGLIGIGPEVGLALSLLRRVRELVFGIPGLVAWQVQEGRRLIQRRDA